MPNFKDKEDFLSSIKDSYEKYYQDIFSEALSGNFETFIENITDKIPLQTAKQKISNNFYIRNVQPKPEFINGGAFIFNAELGLYAFLYNVKIGANGSFDLFVSNINNFETAFKNVQASYNFFSNVDSKNMLPANMTLVDLFVFAKFHKDVQTPSATSKAAAFLEIIVNSSVHVYDYAPGYDVIDMFIEETYITMAAPLLKKYNTPTQYGKNTKGQLISLSNTVLAEHMRDILSSKRLNLKEAILEVNMDQVFQVIRGKITKLLDGFESDFFKKEKE